jgi:hypothetical protein
MIVELLRTSDRISLHWPMPSNEWGRASQQMGMRKVNGGDLPTMHANER